MKTFDEYIAEAKQKFEIIKNISDVKTAEQYIRRAGKKWNKIDQGQTGHINGEMALSYAFMNGDQIVATLETWKGKYSTEGQLIIYK